MSQFPYNDELVSFEYFSDPFILQDIRSQSISTNFTKGEFIDATKKTPSEWRDATGIYYHVNIPKAIQLIRDAYGSPLYLGSLGRTPEWERLQGRDGTSKHVREIAVDVNGGSKLSSGRKRFSAWIKEQIAEKGTLYVSLRDLGVNGIGFYDWGVHLDFRESNGDGSATTWDDDSKKKGIFKTVLLPFVLIPSAIILGIYFIYKWIAK